MLVLGSRFHNTPVMSLQTGARLATTIRPIVDPTNLTVIAFEVDGPLLSEKPAFLRVEEIREVAPIGMIVDSNDEIVGLDDVIKLKKIYGLEFELVGMPVGQVVGRLTEEVSVADVIYQFMDEFVESVERLGHTLDAARSE